MIITPKATTKSFIYFHPCIHPSFHPSIHPSLHLPTTCPCQDWVMAWSTSQAAQGKGWGSPWMGYQLSALAFDAIWKQRQCACKYGLSLARCYVSCRVSSEDAEMWYAGCIAANHLSCSPEMTLDLAESSASFFPGYAAAVDSEKGMWRTGYGSISHAPSIIALPTPQSHLLPAVPFPPLSVSHTSPLQTISAQDLEKSFIWHMSYRHILQSLSIQLYAVRQTA